PKPSVHTTSALTGAPVEVPPEFPVHSWPPPPPADNCGVAETAPLHDSARPMPTATTLIALYTRICASCLVTSPSRPQRSPVEPGHRQRSVKTRVSFCKLRYARSDVAGPSDAAGCVQRPPGAWRGHRHSGAQGPGLAGLPGADPRSVARA